MMCEKLVLIDCLRLGIRDWRKICIRWFWLSKTFIKKRRKTPSFSYGDISRIIILLQLVVLRDQKCRN